MLPAHPPLPTARNLPFHVAVGSHSSIAIRESGDGVSVAATLQWAGGAATYSTAVIVTLGNVSVLSASQDGGCCQPAAAINTSAPIIGEPPWTLATLAGLCGQAGRF